MRRERRRCAAARRPRRRRRGEAPAAVKSTVGADGESVASGFPRRKNRAPNQPDSNGLAALGVMARNALATEQPACRADRATGHLQSRIAAAPGVALPGATRVASPAAPLRREAPAAPLAARRPLIRAPPLLPPGRGGGTSTRTPRRRSRLSGARAR